MDEQTVHLQGVTAALIVIRQGYRSHASNCDRDPKRREYWEHRIDQITRAIYHVSNLSKGVRTCEGM